MQSNVVSGDICEDNVVSSELNNGVDVPVSGTLVQEDDLGKETVFEGMEVECVEEGDSRVVSEHSRAVSERSSHGRETDSLEGEVVAVNDEVDNVEESLNDGCVGKEGKDLVGVEGAINQGCRFKAEDLDSSVQELISNPVNEDRCDEEMEAEKTVHSSQNEVEDLDSSVQELISNPVNEDRCDEEMEAEKTVHSSQNEVDNQSVELKTKDSTTEKEDSGVHVNEEGFSDVKEVSVVDMDNCVRNDKSKNKGGFCASDLVWGKVKSHPWWPAQIFEAGDASDKARKHSKSKGYLVGYFWDQTFAWNDEAKLKPFAPNFSQMVKQTQMEAFRHAVACILDETSRRVEFGLSCRCIPDDIYNQLKVQVVENAGIREESRIREGGDRYFTASSFEPVKFLDYVKDLAQGPSADVDRLEHMITRAQMAAFYRWKGIYHLAEFGLLIGYVNNEADAPVTFVKEKCEVIADGTPPPSTMEEDDIRPKKRKKTSSGGGDSIKKVKCLSDLIQKKGVHKKYDKETKGKAGSKFISSSAGRRKEAKSFPNDSTTKEYSPSGVGDIKPLFSVGESILRVAGQLSQPSPLLKLDLSSHEKTINDEESGEEDTDGKSKEGPSRSDSAEMIEDGCFSGSKSKAKASESTSSTFAVQDTFCMNKTVRVLEQQSSLSDVEMAVVESEPPDVDGISAITQEINSTVSSPQKQNGSEYGASEGGQSDEKIQQEDSPTAITLKFSDVDSIPTEGKLNNIFGHFGPLKESETEVLAKKICARVVFKRRSDAETAFSSSGKFEIFGPSLVCYRLNYTPSPRKSPSVEAKRRKKYKTC
ncbi:hypothetical protein BVRB_007530 [Beta vulgaris subsp. vulgaris]|uniref:PWWP domain-containing protein n=1 Tax=Beta vulgaris subsp. vulgaris TaxID=3555 RepID=A0A0J8B6J6_BETVV|nr:hypothetical protein BVRB_007530 [Beta vulgaris subsp. vulgaris]